MQSIHHSRYTYEIFSPICYLTDISITNISQSITDVVNIKHILYLLYTFLDYTYLQNNYTKTFICVQE